MMRGVVSAGMLLGLEALGLRGSFDAVYGSSAGALNAAYFLAGQARVGITGYLDESITRGFVDPLRVLRGRPAVDLDRVYRDVLVRRFPLDWEAYQRSGAALVAMAPRADGGAGPASGPDSGPDPGVGSRLVALSGFRDLDDLLAALHASARLPIVAGPPLTYRGMRLWDGGLVDRMPVQSALADGYTHVLALLTEPEGARPRRAWALMERLVVAPRVARISPALARVLVRRRATYEATRALIRTLEKSWSGPPFVASITLPRGARRVLAAEMRRGPLLAGARAGMLACLLAFGMGDESEAGRLADEWLAGG